MKWVPETRGFDEAFDAAGTPRRHYRTLISLLESFSQDDVARRERLQKLSLIDQGVTFTVYGEKEGVERIFPFDFVPRIIPPAEWSRIEAGLVQRVTTLNLFIADVYSEQKCLKDGIIPPELILSRREYKRELQTAAPGRPRFLGLSALRAPASRCRRHVVRWEEYNPSRRSSAPTSPTPAHWSGAQST